jgi:hypothetical protein
VLLTKRNIDDTSILNYGGIAWHTDILKATCCH